MPTVLTAEQDALLQEVRRKFEQASKARQSLEKKWVHFHSLYHNYQDFRSAHAALQAPRDRYDSIVSAQRQWGAELFIPYSFAMVETILPRMLSNSPRLLVVPGVKAAEENVETMRQLLNAQQDQITYEMTLQSTAKSGLIFGLGIEKTMWKRTERERRFIRRAIDPQTAGSEFVEGTEADVFDDPVALDIDIFDFFGDPYAENAETLRWGIHRTWRDTAYVLDKLRAKNGKPPVWNAPGLSEQDVQSIRSPQKFDEVWSERLRAMRDDRPSTAGGDIHEVWEFHDGNRVIVVLDRMFPVLEGRNPAWHGDLPFAVYRPTEVLHQLCGKGAIEPMEDLQEEMNTLRSQRRDNATFTLQTPFAFADGFVDEGDLKWGPGIGIPVQGGIDPREAIFPIKVGDIPASGYNEEDRLKGDIEMVTGISDPITGGGGGGGSASSTATEVQVQVAAANERIKNMLTRLEVEMMRRVGQHFIELNQQHIIENKEVRVPYVPKPGEPDRRWAWLEVGPESLAGAMEARPDAGSTAPENVPQNRQDAMQVMQMFGQAPEVDRQKLVEWALKKYGVAQPEMLLAPPVPQVPEGVLTALEQLMANDLQGIGQWLVDQGIAPPQPLVNPEQTVKAMLDEAIQMANAQQPNPQVPQGAAPPGANGAVGAAA